MSTTTSNANADLQAVTVELKTITAGHTEESVAGTPTPAPAAAASGEHAAKGHHNIHPNLKSFANSQHRASGANIDDSEEVILEKRRSFVYSFGLSTHEAEVRLEKYGRNELPEKHIPKWYIFVSQVSTSFYRKYHFNIAFVVYCYPYQLLAIYWSVSDGLVCLRSCGSRCRS
jgi:hypothetical protein